MNIDINDQAINCNLISEHEDGKIRGNEGGRAVLWNSKFKYGKAVTFQLIRFVS